MVRAGVGDGAAVGDLRWRVSPGSGRAVCETPRDTEATANASRYRVSSAECGVDHASLGISRQRYNDQRIRKYRTRCHHAERPCLRRRHIFLGAAGCTTARRVTGIVEEGDALWHRVECSHDLSRIEEHHVESSIYCMAKVVVAHI